MFCFLEMWSFDNEINQLSANYGRGAFGLIAFMRAVVTRLPFRRIVERSCDCLTEARWWGVECQRWTPLIRVSLTCAGERNGHRGQSYD